MSDKTTSNPSPNPAFWVRGLPVFGDLILSPMDGVSDLPFRSLCRALGSAMSYTEFINAIDILNNDPRLALRLTYLETERPLVFQIFDDDPDRLLAAALRLRERNPDIIDVNMGCSAKTVAGRGAGAGLLRTPEKIATIFKKLSHALDIPVTGKIRLGWDEASLNYVQIAKIIEENGGQLVAVHGRTKMQGYTGTANWDAIAEVKQAVRIPVIANGDVRSVADIDAIKLHTGCDGVMIARAALGNPWLFSRLDRVDVPRDQVHQTMILHLTRMLDFYGAERGLIMFRKFAARYLSPYGVTPEKRKLLLTTEDPKVFIALLDEIMRTAEMAAPMMGHRSSSPLVADYPG